MDMLYRYKELFSLGDEIGIHHNIEFEIDEADKTPFFIRPYHVQEEEKQIMDSERKRLCYRGILKEVFFQHTPIPLC